MNPLALDLCCGKGGWTLGLLVAGWDVIGIDNEAWEGYPSRRIIKDVRLLTVDDIKDIDSRPVSLVVASPPCQEFSYRSFPFKRCVYLRDNVLPDKTIWESCERIARELNAPLILENVRGAERYMGKAKIHYGSFYLWGNVPALIPYSKDIKGMTQNKFKDMKHSKWGSKSKERKEWSAKIAMIPESLSIWIGECFFESWKRKNKEKLDLSKGVW